MNTDDKNPESNDEEKPYFGNLKPLTAIQIISLILPSGSAVAGPCY